MFKPILHNVFQSSMHALTIRYRNDLNLGMPFHYCTNVAFLCVVKNEQETDSIGLLITDREAFNTWLFLHCIKYMKSSFPKHDKRQIKKK